MHPVGPHDAQTYWIRRTVVAVLAVALVAGVVWWALGRGSGSGPDTLASTSTTGSTAPQLTGVLATDTATDSAAGSEMQFEEPTLSDTQGSDAADAPPSPAARSDTTGTSAVTATAGTTGTATTTGTAKSPSPAGTVPNASMVETTQPARVTVTVTKLVPATGTAVKSAAATTKPTTTAPPKPAYDSAGRLICPAASISLSAVVWGTVAGQQPRLGMNVTNIGKQTCRQDVSGAKQVYTVYTSAGDRVWSTADCFPGEGTEVRTLTAGQKASFVIVWSGTTSEPGCTAPREKVKAGKYKLVVQLGQLKSKPLAFSMS